MPLGNPKYVPVNVSFGTIPSTTDTYKMGLTYLAKGIERQNEVKDRLVDTNATIQATLNALPVHDSERDWLDNYATNIENKINDYIRQGDYDTALNAARTLAKTAVTDPNVLSRVKRNTEYEAAKAQVQNDKTLSATTKQRWEEENPYEAGLVIDDNGRVNEYAPSWTPLAPIDLTQFYDDLRKYVAPEKGGGESAQFLDADGKLTSDISKGFYGMAVKNGTTWERVSEDRLKKAFDALFAAKPEYKAALLQDMDDARWQYDRANDEDKKKFLGSDIMDDKGEFYSPQEYLDRRVNPMLHEMAYNNRISHMDVGPAFTNKLTDDRAKKAAADKAAKDAAGIEQLLSLMDLNSTAPSFNLDIPMSDRISSAYSSIKENIDALKGYLPEYTSSKEFKDALKTNNFSAIADAIDNMQNTGKLTDKQKGQLKNIAAAIRSDGDFFARTTEGLDKATVDAMTFISSIDSNAELPADNAYTQRYVDAKNKLFSYIENGKPKTAEAIGITFQSKDQREKVLKYLTDAGFSNYEEAGIKLINDGKGNIELRISKNSPALSDLATAYQQNDDTFWSFRRTNIKAYDDLNSYDSHPISNTQFISLAPRTYGPLAPAAPKATDALKSFSKDSDLILSARNKALSGYKTNANANMVVPVQTLPGNDYNIMTLDKIYMDGGNEYLDNTQYEKIRKAFTENNLKAFTASMANPSNQIWYGDPENTGTARELTQEEIANSRNEVLAAISQDRVEISPGNVPTRSRYGTLVAIKPKYDTKNEEISPARYFYIDGLLRNAASRAFADDPETIAAKEFKEDRAAGVSIEDINGDVIDYNSPTAFEDFKLAKELETLYKNINNRRGTENQVTDEQLQAVAKTLADKQFFGGSTSPKEIVEFIKTTRGVDDQTAVQIALTVQNTDEYAAMYQLIYSKLLNKTR